VNSFSFVLVSVSANFWAPKCFFSPIIVMFYKVTRLNLVRINLHNLMNCVGVGKLFIKNAVVL